MSEPVDHPTAKQMRDNAALAKQTVEMLGNDRAGLEAQLEAAQARIAALEEALRAYQHATSNTTYPRDHAIWIAADLARAAFKGGENV